MTTFDAAREVLNRLEATREDGFEGLMLRLLSAHLGVSMRLSSAGPQAGRDMGGGRIAVEAKRYGRSALNVRELAGEISIAKGADQELETWVVVSTQTLPLQRATDLERVAEQTRTDLSIIDWSPVECPQPLVLMARYRDVARRWFDEHAPDSWDSVDDALETLHLPGVPFDRVSGDLDLVASGLALAGKLQETLGRAVDKALADPTGKASRAVFGQRVDFRAPEAKAITRSGVLARLGSGFGDAAQTAAKVLAVLGYEGVGKTWAVIDFVTRLQPGRPLLFLPSALIAEADVGGWSPAHLLREAMRRSFGVLDDCDRRFRDEGFLDRILGALARTGCDAFRPICVFDGFNERRGRRWGGFVTELPGFVGREGYPVLVTTRPPQWRLLASDLDGRDVRHVEIGIDAFSDDEFAAACEANDIDSSAFDRKTAKDMRNPRLFRIAAGLTGDLAGAPVTRERIFCEYWRHRQREGAGGQLSPVEFARLLTAHVRDAWKDLERLELGRTRYFDLQASQEAARFAGVEDAVRDVQDALSSGFFQPGRRDDSGEVRLASDRVDYVLGLSLQRRLSEATDEERNPAANRRSVDDRLAVDMDPIAEFDSAGIIVGTALLATCLQTNRNRAVALACLIYLLELRNARNQEVAPTVRGMVLVAACADPAVFVAAVEEMGERDPWLVEALRTALSASRERHVVADALGHWLGRDFKENDPAVTALHVLAGHQLGTYRDALRRRRSPEGQHDLVFWLALLDEASRLPLMDLFVDEESDETDDGDLDCDEEEDHTSTALMGALLREDFDRASPEHPSSTGDTEDFLSADGPFGPILEAGEVPVLPASLGGDWKRLEERLPTALAARWSGNDPSVQLLYVQLLENRLAMLPPERRPVLLASVFAASPPPSSPSNYELRSFLPLPPDGIADLLAAAIGTHEHERLLWTLGWLNYFFVENFEIREPLARELVARLVDREVDANLRADIALLLMRSGSLVVAGHIVETGWRPDGEPRSTVALHAATAIVPLCRAEGTYPALRDMLVATVLGAVVEQVHESDLHRVVSDFDDHVGESVRDLLGNTYPGSRTASAKAIDPDGSDRLIPLATLEITDIASRRIAREDVSKPIGWFRDLMDMRSAFWGDEAVMEFLAHLLVGIADVDEVEAARGLDRLVSHMVEVMADADDGVLVPAFLVHTAFAFACTPSATAVASRLVRAASDDATLALVAVKACGPWRDWLSEFCLEERRSGRPARAARARTIQALAGLPAEPLSGRSAPVSIEQFCELVEAERQTAECALESWRVAGEAERERLEAEFLDTASGQALRLPDLAGAGDTGRLFLARIALHQRAFMESRGRDLFGVSNPPTRFVACNDPIRSFPGTSNRRRRFAERDTG